MCILRCHLISIIAMYWEMHFQLFFCHLFYVLYYVSITYFWKNTFAREHLNLI